jgi:hypothetical protein
VSAAEVETTMRRSWLVQRLRKPHVGTGPLESLVNAFSFGGGLRNGGLTEEAMGLLRGVFSFDYMGSAEFEWGAVPKALQNIASTEHLAAGSFSIPLSEVAPDWRERDEPAAEGEATVYFLCRRNEAAEVERRARQWASEGYRAHLKESPHINSTLRPCNEWDGQTVGWLELDNGFFLFADRDMWEQTAALFGVSIDPEVPR